MKKLRQFDMESYRILAELSNAIMFEWDIATDRFYVSSNWKLKFGTEPQQEDFSHHISQIFFMYPDDPDELTPYIKNIKDNNELSEHTKYYQKIELRLLTKKQIYIWFQLRLLLRYNAKGLPDRIFCMITDINLQKKEYENLLYQAQMDVLTGLYNKATTQAMIIDYLKKAHLQNKNQALFIIDIDGFKEVNDHFGHLFGDAVISDLAHCIHNSFRKSDIVGRIGGDEFIVLFKNITTEELIIKKAQELINLLQRKYTSNGTNYKVSASIGIVVSPLYGTRFDDLFQKADHALYYVKEHGKNNFRFFHENLPAPQYSSTRTLEITNAKNKKNQKAFFENVIEYIFKILYRSQDANVAINLILEIIGRKYNISRTFILEKNCREEYCNTFEWCDDGIASLQSEQQNIAKSIAEKFFSHFDENGIFSCGNTTLLPAELKTYFKKSPVKALLECAMLNEGTTAGVIGFEYHHHARLWKNEEIEVLSFTAEILSTFLLKKRVFDKMKRSHMQTLEILDHIDSFIYVIDKNTHEILFANKKSLDVFGTDQLGKCCYDFISCEKEPCKYCPVLLLTESIDQAQTDIYFSKRDLWVHAAVSKIHWDNTREVCLLHCHDTTNSTSHFFK